MFIWRVLKGKKQSGPRSNGNWIGPARILPHQRRYDGRLGRLVWCVHDTNLYRAALEHIRPATTREMFFQEVHSANLYPRKFGHVLQSGEVPDGVWTDLLDQEGPLADAVERPEGNELNEEGLGEQVPRKRIQIKAKTYETAPQTEPNEDLFTIQEESANSSTTEIETAARTLSLGNASG